MTHTVYQPNDYEEMMIAAGWITLESCDDEYQAYLRSNPPFEEFIFYSSWQVKRAEWDRLNAIYEAKFPDPCALRTGQQEVEERNLLKQMGEIELYLGY